jgi:hypothetical protein
MMQNNLTLLKILPGTGDDRVGVIFSARVIFFLRVRTPVISKSNNNMKGIRPIVMNMEGTPPLTGRALPNLINAVSMFKVKVNVNAVFDFNVLTALKGWVGHAPQGRGALHIIII